MPDRIIRDELFRSRRFIRLTSDTIRLLFIGLILSADDLANAEATTEAIAEIMRREVNDETAARWLSELADAGLVRAYQVADEDRRDGPRTYVHIPRFRQRLRWHKGKHPIPPAEVESKEIKELREKVSRKAGGSQPQDGHKTAEEKRSEEKRSEVIQTQRAREKVAVVQNPKPVLERIGDHPPKRAKGPQDEPGIEALARYFGKWPLQGDNGRDWSIACAYVNQLRDQFFDGK